MDEYAINTCAEALAVKMANSLNKTLVCAFEKNKLIILCGEHRIRR